MEELRRQLLNYVDVAEPKLFPGLERAVYAMSETGAWQDSVGSVSAEQAILCWQLVEKLRQGPFPEELRV